MRFATSRGRVPAVVVLGLTLALALAAVACGGDDSNDSAPATAGGTAVQITMRDNSFNPRNISVPAGKEITFTLDNKGQAIHNMSVRVDGRTVVSQPDAIRAGATGKLVATFANAGTYDFKCDFHPAEMTGKITVK